MEKLHNESYRRIMDYVKENRELTEMKKRFLISYATQLKLSNIENKPTETIQDILESLKELNSNLKDNEETSVVINRIQKEIKILDSINDYYKKEIELDDISYELDKLYYYSTSKVRKNSSLSYNLKKHKGSIIR